MKALKYIFILLLVVVIGGAVYFSLQDGTYTFEETALVEAPKELVYNKISNLQTFEEWNKSSPDNQLEITLGEQSKGVDAYLNFKDDEGSGKIVITSLVPDEQVRMQLIYNNGSQESITEISYNLSNIDKNTQVQFTANGEKDLKNKFWSKLFGSRIENVILPNLEDNPKSLESLIQTEMAVHSAEIDGIVSTSGGYYLFITQSTSLTNMSIVKNKLASTIENYMEERSIKAAGDVLVQYEKRDMLNNVALITVAIPVRERVITEVESNMLCDYKEPEKTVKVILKGNHSNLNEAWDKGLEFIANNGLVKSEAPAYEIYRNDPADTINPADLITEIYIPID